MDPYPTLAVTTPLQGYSGFSAETALQQGVCSSYPKHNVEPQVGVAGRMQPVVTAAGLYGPKRPDYNAFVQSPPAAPAWSAGRTAGAEVLTKGKSAVPPVVEEMPLHDHVQLYLREMARTALLTAEEEVDLAKRYEAGLEAERLLEVRKRIAAGRKRQLNLVDRDGKRAKERLVQANLRLVVSVAKRYQGQGLPLLDLIQEGNLGLLRAVEKFDYRRGYKFSTYATWWIRQAVGRGVADKGRTIRLPVHMMERVRRALSMQRDLAEALGREPTIEELSEELGEEVATVEELLTYARTPTSLETPVGEDGDAELGDFIEDRNAEDPLEMAAKGLARQELLDVVAGLPERERIILELRFGLLDGEARTLDDVGRYFGLTRERIRQLEARALSKLRHPSRGRALSDTAA